MNAREIISDEAALLASLVPLEGARVVELGCGKAEFARRMAQHTPVASVTALEVDAVQHRRNMEGERPPKLDFAFGGGEAPYWNNFIKGTGMKAGN